MYRYSSNPPVAAIYRDERRGEGRSASGSAACGASLSTAMLDAEFTGHCSAQE
jgi:hypothetical protein